MGARELTALGTGSFLPTRTRNHSGYMLRWGRRGVLLDSGEGTQRQMTLAGVSVRSIEAICLTHLHGDHCLGLPGVLQRISVERVLHPVTVLYPAEGQEYIDLIARAEGYDVIHARLFPL